MIEAFSGPTGHEAPTSTAGPIRATNDEKRETEFPMTNEGIIPLRVPQDLRERCERIAADRRRATGQNVQWTEIARELITEGCRRYEKDTKRQLKTDN